MTTLAWYFLAAIIVAAIIAPWFKHDADDDLPEQDVTIDNVRWPR